MRVTSPDRAAVCEDISRAQPVHTGFRPDEDALPTGIDLVVCVSLLTHTRLEHWRRTLRAWFRMIEPGGHLVFTYLSKSFTERWLAGELEHYGTYTDDQRRAAVAELERTGHAFVGLDTTYSKDPEYGVAFATRETVVREATLAGFEVLEAIDGPHSWFGQSIALLRKPRKVMPKPRARLVTIYNPRYYASAGAPNGESQGWSRLCASKEQRALPTEFGFYDPRVPEVREAQVELAKSYGISAFCFRYFWANGEPAWVEPIRDLLESGRPDFPFCLMWTPDSVPQADRAGAEACRRWAHELSPYLADPRYLRHGRRPLRDRRCGGSCGGARGAGRSAARSG